MDYSHRPKGHTSLRIEIGGGRADFSACIRKEGPMTTHHISTVAHLIGEPVRSVMLISLADGGSWPAGALAEAAGVTAQTASAHLAKLLDGGLLTVQRQGRHRYYRLAGPHVVNALESLAGVRVIGVRPISTRAGPHTSQYLSSSGVFRTDHERCKEATSGAAFFKARGRRPPHPRPAPRWTAASALRHRAR
ncbi:ArsR/SmtB family transcription factor [Verminephrobacter aporrectodeae]|uniref:ArsR/SmtB family transcription factor n=2 Tax=Verminephrobacter aporrectodeae TaxID=1110389 RepID=UPI002ADDF089|nr:winged helix-turn-helix domain-containing protein [Verminephrobacter aporrectodeae]